MSQKIEVATLGVPRIGPHRELKSALESYWAGEIDEAQLMATARALKAENWRVQRRLGVTHIPSNDFSLYDHVLDAAIMVGAIPDRYSWDGGAVPLSTYFAMARGAEHEAGFHEHAHASAGDGHGVPALEMTKWFDTNYHYMVPEFAPDQRFALTGQKPVDDFLEARALDIHTRPVLVGPVTFLKLGKAERFDPLVLLPRLLPVYEDLLGRLAASGADWVQIDEPILALDLDAATRDALGETYRHFAHTLPALKVMLATYFGGLGDNLDVALNLPVAGLHVDLVRAPAQLDSVLAKAPAEQVLELGVIDGRNVWRADLPALLDRLEPIVVRRGPDRLVLAPSCSLLHVPVDLATEAELDPELRSWLAFGRQKMAELKVLATALSEERDAVAAELAASAESAESRRTSPRTNDPAVEDRLGRITPAMTRRASPFATRRALQQQRLGLPAFPTTTIGSFPQTREVREARAAHARGRLSDADYRAFLEGETERAIRFQEEIGLDVLVHGEFERNDMVQYFGEQLAGYAFTRHGWVQSYGSRCVRPPIIYGDVRRPGPMTVEWARYAQSLTEKPVKGMLTGPVTMLQWSFVRDDQPRSETCLEIALALRDEVADLEAAGIRIIQVDEPALREGLPLRHADWPTYLDWAVRAFRLAVSGVADTTQVHTHMCYAEFNDIIEAIGAMDADVISIETSRSKMELLDAFSDYRYPNDIGPGVYDIHSPRAPSFGDMLTLLRKAAERLPAGRLWVNPDCGLKTRGWAEVRPALVEMVAAAKRVRGATA